MRAYAKYTKRVEPFTNTAVDRYRSQISSKKAPNQNKSSLQQKDPGVSSRQGNNMKSRTNRFSAKKIQITEEMTQALKAMDSRSARQPALLNGGAGTGKSTLLKYYMDQKKDSNMVALAPTGVAALNVRGQTIHRFFGFKIHETPDRIRDESHRRIPKSKKEVFKKIDTIVIDEASMLRADLLDCIDQFLRRYGPARNCAFGGVHMVFVGDLYQLPPCVTSEERDVIRAHYDSPHFFNAHALKETGMDIVELTHVFRQSDRKFAALLDRMRKGEMTNEDFGVINGRFAPDTGNGTSRQHITLTGTNRKAAMINEQRLNTLPGKKSTAHANMRGQFSRDSLPTEMELNLKKGAQVMMLNNDQEGRWVNGSLGEVVDISTASSSVSPNKVNNLAVRMADTSQVVKVGRHKWESWKFAIGSEGQITPAVAGEFTQFPLKLAWAVTVHKAQGKTFNNVTVDMDRAFATGQTYVALSRCTTLEGITLRRKIGHRDVRHDHLVKNFLEGKNDFANQNEIPQQAGMAF